jgi:alanine racemase
MVRPGIGIYGIAPAPGVDGGLDLRPALSVKARISFVKRLRAGDALSYGLRRPLAHDAWIATVPIGYADGVPRALGSHDGVVLVGGRRCHIAGTVTMDQIMVDLGDDDATVGDEVVLLGAQGDEYIGAQEWAKLLDTIAYEIVCGIGPRVPRRFVGAAAPKVRS